MISLGFFVLNIGILFILWGRSRKQGAKLDYRSMFMVGLILLVIGLAVMRLIVFIATGIMYVLASIYLGSRKASGP